MKTILTLAVILMAGLSFSGCTTARDATADTLGLAGHAVQKTGHAMEHGARKVEDL